MVNEAGIQFCVWKVTRYHTVQRCRLSPFMKFVIYWSVYIYSMSPQQFPIIYHLWDKGKHSLFVFSFPSKTKSNWIFLKYPFFANTSEMLLFSYCEMDPNSSSLKPPSSDAPKYRCVAICLSALLSIYLSTYLSICNICICLYLSTYLPIYLSTYLPLVNLSIHPSVYLSICESTQILCNCVM